MKKLFLLLLPCLAFADTPSPAVYSCSARASGLRPGEPVEFILIGPHSGHAYESLIVSDVPVEEIDQSLRELGLQPGHPVQPNRLRFWPRGDVLDVHVAWEKDGEQFEMPAEQLVIRQPEGSPLEEAGWIFTGSQTIEKEGRTELLAAIQDPGSILPVYNEAESLLDRPVIAPKQSVYQTLFPNPQCIFTNGQKLTISFRPKDPQERYRPRDWILHMDVGEAGVVGSLRRADAVPMENKRLPQPLQTLREMLATADGEPSQRFLTPHPSPALTLGELRDAYVLLEKMEAEGLFKLNPPAGQDLFYKAFLPDPSMRKPEARPSQPWEIHLPLDREGDVLLRRYSLRERDLQGNPSFDLKEMHISAGSDLTKPLERSPYGLPVLLLFVHASMPYGELLDVLQPLRSEYDTLYLFIEPEA